MTILIGNDELILHLRKNYKRCKKTNDRLGKMIWEWLKKSTLSQKKSLSTNHVHGAIHRILLPRQHCQRQQRNFGFQEKFFPLFMSS